MRKEKCNMRICCTWVLQIHKVLSSTRKTKHRTHLRARNPDWSRWACCLFGLKPSWGLHGSLWPPLFQSSGFRTLLGILQKRKTELERQWKRFICQNTSDTSLCGWRKKKTTTAQHDQGPLGLQSELMRSKPKSVHEAPTEPLLFVWMTARIQRLCSL